jgi:non-canonical purine NTP pyrophosphatase (RdgB/HAM1 family)
MYTIVLASNNDKKAREMRSLLPDEFEVITAREANVEMPDETGSTFEENALLKARAAARQSGRVSVADDSGLEIDALEGAPGVRSARFAADHGRTESDEENNNLALEKLSSVPAEDRTARFVSAVAVVANDGREIVVRGTVEGAIGFEPRGQNGFGYDPLFVPSGYERTMSELSNDEKNEISHRGRAFEQALPYILRFVHDVS